MAFCGIQNVDTVICTIEMVTVQERKKGLHTFPNTPGVYLMRDRSGMVIYVGKAGSLKKRVLSYYQKGHDVKTELLVRDIDSIDYEQTDTVLEATFREAMLIKRFQPRYNIQQKDDKSFMYVVVTNDPYPRVLMKRGKEINATLHFIPHKTKEYLGVFGPFSSAHLLRSLLKLVRKIMPFSSCLPPKAKIVLHQKRAQGKPCFYYHLHQCPGVCAGEIDKKEYKKIIHNLILFFQGKKKIVLRNLKKEMQNLSGHEKFEAAAKIRNQLYNLEHIQDTSLITRDWPSFAHPFKRMEGYDISNISGTHATGSMVVFENGEPNKKEYRKFKIKTIQGSNDIGMLIEVLARRLKHTEWTLPSLILIDGGKAHVHAAQTILKQFKLAIPLVGIAKGSKRNKADFYFGDPKNDETKKISDEYKDTLIHLRDEAHRFALSYHKLIRKHSRN